MADRSKERKARYNERLERITPCLKEQGESLSCLDRHYYEREKCEPFFENYKSCKTFWHAVARDRRARGIKPYLPEPGDRQNVKEEYLSKIFQK